MINYYKKNGVFILELADEVTLTTLSEIRSRIDSLDLRQYPKVVIDLSKVSFFDSSGIGYLVILVKSVKMANGQVALAAPKPMIKKLLATIKVDKFVEIYDDLDDAIHAMTANEAAEGA